jgi:Fe-S cluster assembly iron-binding protein IscA
MLQLSHEAVALLSRVQRAQGLPESYWLRVYGQPVGDIGTAVHVAFIQAPEPGDQVASHDGMQVSVDQTLARPLSRAFIDVEHDENRERLVLKGIEREVDPLDGM